MSAAPKPGGCPGEAPRGYIASAEDIELFERTEPDDDHSAIYCRCGDYLVWSGLSEELGPFVEQHKKHMTAKRSKRPATGRTAPKQEGEWSMKRATEDLLRVARSIDTRITDDGRVLGRHGLTVDLAHARFLLDTIEATAFPRPTQVRGKDT